ncbi:MAG: hypothetical protein NTX64_01905, partial [Elusimicrobia bacterium]|nr:hypothetical protein [Elusimicrobiota bacterium]
MKRLIRFAFLLAFVAPAHAASSTPQQFVYQGTLRRSGAIYTGTATFNFSIFDAPVGGSLYWTSGSTVVYVSGGLFRYPLGVPGPTGTAASLSSINWGAITPYVEVKIDANTLQPRERLLAVPYALSITSVTPLSDGVHVTSNLIVDTAKIGVNKTPTTELDVNGTATANYFVGDGSNAVTTSAILNANVTAPKLVNAGVFTGDAATTFPALTISGGAIQTAKLAADAVTTSAILNANVTAAKLVNSGIFTGDAVTTFPTLTISNNAITAVKMVNAGVFTGDAATTFPALTISNSAIQTAKVATDAITNAKILTSAVDTRAIAPDAVAASELLNAAVQTAKLAADAVTNSAVLNATLLVSKLAASGAGANNCLVYGGSAWAPGACSSGGGITGSGTTNKLPKFATSSTLGDSSLSDNGTTVTTAEGLSANSLTLTTDLTVGNGGTGAGTFTTNGMLYGNATSAIGATGAGTQYQVFQAGASGVPTVAALNLGQSAAITGILPAGNGGTGANTLTTNGMLYGNAASAVGATGAGTQYQVFQAGASGVPTVGALNLGQSAAITGTLPVGNGGTGNTIGNAATVTNGVYTSGSYADPSWLTALAGSKVTGNISGNAANITGNLPGAQVSGNIAGNAANVTGTVASGNGGTGIATPAVGAILVGSGGNPVGTVADVAAGSVLVSNGVGASPVYSNAPSLSQLTVTSTPV